MLWDVRTLRLSPSTWNRLASSRRGGLTGLGRVPTDVARCVLQLCKISSQNVPPPACLVVNLNQCTCVFVPACELVIADDPQLCDWTRPLHGDRADTVCHQCIAHCHISSVNAFTTVGHPHVNTSTGPGCHRYPARWIDDHQQVVEFLCAFKCLYAQLTD